MMPGKAFKAVTSRTNFIAIDWSEASNRDSFIYSQLTSDSSALRVLFDWLWVVLRNVVTMHGQAMS